LPQIVDIGEVDKAVFTSWDSTFVLCSKMGRGAACCGIEIQTFRLFSGAVPGNPVHGPKTFDLGLNAPKVYGDVLSTGLASTAG